MFKKIRNEMGVGLLEAVIAASLILILGASISYWTSSNRKHSFDMSSAATCDGLTNALIAELKSNANSINIRNWVTSATTDVASAETPADPYCSNVGGRTPVCDTQPLLELAFPGTGIKYVTAYRNFQNIRGSTMWAQNVYNTRGSAICIGDGINLSPAAFGQLFITPTYLPPWVQSVNLYIRDTSVPCGTVSSTANAKFDVRFKINQARLDRGVAAVESCTRSAGLTFPSDSSPPTVSYSITNGNGEPVPPGACTYRGTVSDLIASPSPTFYQTVTVRATANESGVLFLCRKNSSFDSDAAGMFSSCPDMDMSTSGATVTVTPNDSTLSYNTNSQIQMDFSTLTDHGSLSYILQIKAADVAGNESPLQDIPFQVRLPSCVDSSTYCPNAIPAAPASSASAGINIQPYDDCLNGLCPTGTHSICNAATAPTVCVGTNYADDCGLLTCPGSKVGGGCAACVPAVACQDPTTFCGAPAMAADSCGTACAAGTNCSCTPAVACQDPTTFCGAPAMAADSCGTACAAGTNCTCIPAVACQDAGTFCGAPAMAVDSCGTACPTGANCPGCVPSGMSAVYSSCSGTIGNQADFVAVCAAPTTVPWCMVMPGAGCCSGAVPTPAQSSQFSDCPPLGDPAWGNPLWCHQNCSWNITCP